MVEAAQARRAPSEQWVEGFARVYTPAMMVLALGVAIVPPLAMGDVWSYWFYEALVILVIIGVAAAIIYMRVFKFDELVQEPKIDFL